MTIEKQFPSGMWIVTDIVNGYLVTRRYAGYTKREALALFKHDINPNDKAVRP